MSRSSSGFNSKAPDLCVGQLVTYRNNPFDPSVPMDNRVKRVERIEASRSRSTGNQCVKVEGDMMIRDVNELEVFNG